MQRKERNASYRQSRYTTVPRRKKRTGSGSNILTALIGFLFLVCVSVVLVLNLRSIYYFDVDYLQLEQQTGLSAELIRENYDVLIDYNLIWGGVRELEFPSFPMSESGRIHFEEVKMIFVVIQCLAVILGAVFLISLIRKLLRRDFGVLKLVSIFTLVIPTILGILAFFWWDKAFVLFHNLFFNNDYWLFDPATDPVITILPDLFFGHCAAAIILFLLLGGALSGMIYGIAVQFD